MRCEPLWQNCIDSTKPNTITTTTTNNSNENLLEGMWLSVPSAFLLLFDCDTLMEYNRNSIWMVKDNIFVLCWHFFVCPINLFTMSDKRCLIRFFFLYLKSLFFCFFALNVFFRKKRKCHLISLDQAKIIPYKNTRSLRS